ncbi:SRPBCC domain-containing protein [Nocardia vulneris]|uniref:SRPBCC family protein n=1 Tax=Nocardia vulneris TaxID=1141657 RepID=UPI0030CC977A
MIADAQLDPAAVELGIFCRRPPAVVWRALTEPDQLQRWLLRPTPFTATAGARFRFTAAGALHQICCEVLVATPYEQLTYSWVRNAVERSWKRCVLPRLGAALEHGGPPPA